MSTLVKCDEHRYLGLLPCPVQGCSRNGPVSQVEVGPLRYEPERFTDDNGEALYTWSVGNAVLAAALSTWMMRFGMLVRDEGQGGDGYPHHFTNFDTLWKILESGELWLTDYGRMNDSTEGTHGLDLLREVAAESNVGGTIRSYLQAATDMADKNRHRYFVACFSTVRDDLMHWSMYGDAGRGVALTFSPLPWGRAFEVDAWACGFSCLAYQDNVKRSLLRLLVVLLDQAMVREQLLGTFRRDLWQEMLFLVVSQRVMPLFKHETFAAEREFRVLLNIDQSSRKIEPRSFQRSDGPVSYVSTKDLAPNVPLSIRRITIGPRVDVDLEDVRARVRATGYDVPVDRSVIPWR